MWRLAVGESVCSCNRLDAKVGAKTPRGAVVPAQEIAANRVCILTPVMTAGMLAWNTHAIISPVHSQSCLLDVCKCTSSRQECETIPQTALTLVLRLLPSVCV